MVRVRTFAMADQKSSVSARYPKRPGVRVRDRVKE